MKIARWGGSIAFFGAIYMTFQCGQGAGSGNHCEERTDGGLAIEVFEDRGALRIDVDPNGVMTTSIVVDGVEILSRRSWVEGEVVHLRMHFVDQNGGQHDGDASVHGDVLDGTVDGRAVAPFKKGASYDDLRFSDGSTPSTFQWSPETLKLVDRLNQLADEQKQHCGVAVERGGIGTQSVPAAPESPQSGPACKLCKFGCSQTFTACTTGFCVGLCGKLPFPLNFICGGFCVAGCFIVADTCVNACKSGVCCPVSCGLKDVWCCNGGSKCAIPSFSPNVPGLCCPSFTATVCVVGSTANCCFAGEACNTKTAECCGSGADTCGTKCCPVAHPSCKSTSSEACCDVTDTLCGASVCCPTGTKCINPNGATPKDACCPNNQVQCGTQCCDPGAQCLNMGGKQVCGNCSTVICGAFPNEVCCPPGDACTGLGVCCIPKTICDNQTCCGGSQTCVLNGQASKQTCCDDMRVCGGPQGPNTVCCPVNVQILKSDLTGDTTCCDTSVGVPCGGTCCDNKLNKPNCVNPVNGTCG